MSLHVAIESILDGMVAAVEAAVADPEHELAAEGIGQVVRGDRVRGGPTPPAIWIVPRRAVFTQSSYGNERWKLPVDIAGLTRSDQPPSGSIAAQRLTALARLVCLNATIDPAVDLIDITSETFDPTARTDERNKALTWCYASVLVTFDTTDARQ